MQVSDIGSLRKISVQYKAAGKTISFVPTMGALHAGHKSCIEIAREHGDVLLVSIYVNPKQFAPNEDFDKYPRMLNDDVEFCGKLGCDVVFTPDDGEMYPLPQSTWVTVDGLTERLCGRTRPDHFTGVTTVVAKLFNIVHPHVAVFGQKDAQQALVIRRMTQQLDFPVRLLLSPTVREADGLAVSSRNKYILPDDRSRAAAIYQSLCRGKEMLEKGERNPDHITRGMREYLS
ncbi:MAG: pantoate--beta-alanine ligase, partial [Candidatus Latescibacterota bacterium]